MLGLGLAAACGPHEPPLVSPGTSTVSAVTHEPAQNARDAATKWDGFADLGTYRSAGKPFLSRGHFAGRWIAEVLVTPTASDTYAGLTRSSHFATGAVLAKKHTEKDSHAPGPIFVMIKHDPGYFPEGGDWEYLVTDPEGWIEDRGAIASCARCHAEATSNWVFGLPSEARGTRP
jgi:hypothetical protein